MKKYIYLGLLVAFAMVGATFAHAEDDNEGGDDMGRPVMQGEFRKGDDMRPGTRPVMMKGEFRGEDRNEDENENENGDDNEGMRKGIVGERGFGKFEGSDNRSDMRNLTKEEKTTLKEKFKMEKEKAKDLAEHMKEIMKKDNSGDRVKAFLRFDAAIARMDTLVSRVESRITKVTAEGTDATTATAEVTKAKASIADAKTKFAELKTKLQTIESTSTDSTDDNDDSDDASDDSDNRKANNDAFKAETAPLVKAIKDDLLNAQKSLTQAVKVLRSLAPVKTEAGTTTTTTNQ